MFLIVVVREYSKKTHLQFTMLQFHTLKLHHIFNVFFFFFCFWVEKIKLQFDRICFSLEFSIELQISSSFSLENVCSKNKKKARKKKRNYFQYFKKINTNRNDFFFLKIPSLSNPFPCSETPFCFRIERLRALFPGVI